MYLWVTVHDVMEMKDDRHFLIDESSGQKLPVPVSVVDDLED